MNGNEYFRNVTEVHYNYEGTSRVAFESDIHATGIIRDISCIQEIVIEQELEKQDDF